MLARSHPFTALGLIIGLCGLLLLITPFAAVVPGLLFLAYGLTLLEFKRYTSNFQFGMLLSSGTALGIVLDMDSGTWPFLTVALLLAASATIARQAFMQQFTYVNYLWLDTGSALVAIGLYSMAVLGTPFQWERWLLPLLPLVCATGLTFSYVQDARFMRKRTRSGYRVKLGAAAPDFALPDQGGELVRLSEFRGKHPVLLIFVRGDWCPGCHMMLRTYERNREKFKTKGIRVLGIGPDNIEVNRDMVKRLGVGYHMLSDDAQLVSGKYGVVYKNPLLERAVDYSEGIPLPASFLVDIDGVVRYVSRPDRVGEFPNPELIFNVLDELPTEGRVAWS